MYLLDLPPELLLLTTQYLGASFFRDDLRRLTLCKLWYPFARTVLLADLKLSAKSLAQVLFAPGAARRLEYLKSTLRGVEFALDGFDDWESILPTTTALSLGADASTSTGWNEDDSQVARAEWTSHLNDNLSNFLALFRTCCSLRTFRFTAFSECHPRLPALPRRNYLYEPTMSRLLSLSNLTTLELDTCGTSFISRNDHQGQQQVHLCSHISRLLSQLHCLRLRMRHICPCVLHPPECDDTRQLKLNKLILNLSLANESPEITSAAYAQRCNSSGGGFLQLRTEIEEQAGLLVERIACPRTVRVLSHEFPSLGLRSLDVLAGKRMVLLDGAAWDEDGKTECGDSGQESDFSDDSFSSFEE